MAIKTYLTSDEIKQMIAQAPSLREKLILSFLADTGVRVSEFLSIRFEHVDFEKNQVLIPHLKRGIKKKCPICDRASGRSQSYCSHCGCDLRAVPAEGVEERSRLITVSPGTMKLIERWMERMPGKGDRLMPHSRQFIHKVVRDAGRRIGITQILNPVTRRMHELHPHIFRASLAVYWLSKAGSDAAKQKALQEHLGHRKFDTTMQYNKLSPSDVSRISEEIRQGRLD